MACADCGLTRIIMLVQGNGLEVCGRCYRGTVHASTFLYPPKIEEVSDVDEQPRRVAKRR